MRKTTRREIFCFVCFWCLVGIMVLSGSAWSDESSRTNTIMHPDKDTLRKWIQAYEEAPVAYMDEAVRLLIPRRGSVSLLSRLDYTPTERDQGGCGNCWAWSGTAVMTIALDVQKSVHDRLSVQYLNSCYDTAYACCGGWLEYVADYYTDVGQAVPWSNTNAEWQDGSQECSDGSSDVLCGSVSTSVRYPIKSIVAQAIETHGVSKEQAIANIKNVLHQNKAIWFAFYMSTEADWVDFSNFWNNQDEDVLWDFDSTCGQDWIDGEGGGHAVLCVGYNDDDPNNSYWIMLNSWGKNDGRPNGLFRVDMDVDYSCTFNDDGETYYSLYWQTLDIDFGTASSATTNSATSITSGSATLNGSVNPNLESTTWYFEYGTTTDYGSTTTSTSAGSGADNIPVSASIDGLIANATHHFRLVSVNSEGTTHGADKSFDTPAAPPTVTTGLATSVTFTSAVLNGTVNPNNMGTTYYFEYGTTTDYDSATTTKDAGSGTDDVSVTVQITGLSTGTIYHFRLVSANSAGTTNGDDKTLTTSSDGGGGSGTCFIATAGGQVLFFALPLDAILLTRE